MGLAVACIVLAIGAYCLLDLFATPFQRVSRARVEKFARRQSLIVTVDNGPVVIRYLATARRWRGGCLLLTAMASVLVPLAVQMFWPPHPLWQPRLNSLTLFAGWFVGAVIAEWRVSTAAAGRRRSAVLQPRRLAEYLPRPSRVVATACWLLLAMFEVLSLGLVVPRHRNAIMPVLAWLALTALAAAVLIGVGRHVLVRPQRHTAADLLAADDAIRSRSLHVLVGCSLAIAGYLLSGLMGALGRYPSILTDGAAVPVEAIGVLLAPVLGLLVATSSVPPIRRHAPLFAEEAP